MSDEDQLLDLYHRTTPEEAAAIRASGRFVTRENTDKAYVSNRVHGQAEGYGEAIVHVQVSPTMAELEDEFPDGEQHFRVPLDAAHVVEAFIIDPAGERVPLPREVLSTTSNPDTPSVDEREQLGPSSRAREERWQPPSSAFAPGRRGHSV